MTEPVFKILKKLVKIKFRNLLIFRHYIIKTRTAAVYLNYAGILKKYNKMAVLSTDALAPARIDLQPEP